MIIKKSKVVLYSVITTLLLTLAMPLTTVLGAIDPTNESSSDMVTNFINVGLSIVDETEYVFGGGHSDWDVQRTLDVPTGLDNSSFVAWTLYRGMGIDLGKAPTAGEYENFFNVVQEGGVSEAKRGDLIASKDGVEIYIGKDDEGKHYSLRASNDRSSVALVETNWGRNLKDKKVLRIDIEDVANGKNGMKLDGEVIIDLFGERAIGGEGGIMIDLGDGTQKTGEGNKTTGGTTSKAEDTDKEDKEEKEEEVEEEEEEESEDEDTEDSNGYTEEDLFTWLDPMVDFSGTSNTHAESDERATSVNSNSKGLRGNTRGIFDSMFGRFDK